MSMHTFNKNSKLKCNSKWKPEGHKVAGGKPYCNLLLRCGVIERFRFVPTWRIVPHLLVDSVVSQGLLCWNAAFITILIPYVFRLVPKPPIHPGAPREPRRARSHAARRPLSPSKASSLALPAFLRTPWLLLPAKVTSQAEKQVLQNNYWALCSDYNKILIYDY